MAFILDGNSCVTKLAIIGSYTKIRWFHYMNLALKLSYVHKYLLLTTQSRNWDHQANKVTKMLHIWCFWDQLRSNEFLTKANIKYVT